MTAIGPGTLKAVVLGDAEDAGPVLDALLAWLSGDEVRRLADHAFLVHTEHPPSTIRDRLARASGKHPLLVVEFEVWSGHGEIGRDWLLARGH